MKKHNLQNPAVSKKHFMKSAAIQVANCTGVSKRFIDIILIFTMVIFLLSSTPYSYGEPLQDSSENMMTRSGFISMLANNTNEDISAVSKYDKASFNDVAKGTDYIDWAYSKWLINGNPENLFRPNDEITKQEAAVILGRYLDYKYTALNEKNEQIPSIADIPDWAANEIEKCYKYGIISSESESFNPKAGLTAEEADVWISSLSSIPESAVVHAASDTFSDSLTSQLKKEGNWSISPYSIRMCMAMLANGAQGGTKQEILNALKIEDLGTFNANVKKQLSEYDGYQKIMSLETSNSIWLNQSWFENGKGRFLDTFKNKIKDNYRADAFEVINSNSVEKINEWVNEKTKGKIPAIATEDERKFVTALINAVYFKASWQNEFNENQTKSGDFKNADGSISKTDLMHQTDYFGYYSTPGIEAVKMDYKNYSTDNKTGDNFELFSNADFSMYLIKSEDPDIAIENLLNQAEFKMGKVKLTLPKFKVEYFAELDDAFQALGIVDVYDNKKITLPDIIDISLLKSDTYFLDTVLHKTYISVDEKGTEAAAVTAAFEGGAGSIRNPLVREFTADEPFFFAIRDNANKDLLFVGRYEKVD